LNSGVPVETMPPAMIWSFGRSSALVTMTAGVVGLRREPDTFLVSYNGRKVGRKINN
jgi:hypothetical protein